jgi:hypothetical protein
MLKVRRNAFARNVEILLIYELHPYQRNFFI